MIKFKDLYIMLAPETASVAHGCVTERKPVQVFAQTTRNSGECCQGTFSIPAMPLVVLIDQPGDPGELHQMPLKDFLKGEIDQFTVSDMLVPETIQDLGSAIALARGLTGALEAVQTRIGELQQNS